MKYSMICLALLSAGRAIAQDYHPGPLPIPTRWTAQVSPDNALPAYPRPQMVREGWQNLNGLWDYKITTADAAQPTTYDGKILVPYPLESALSGVEKPLMPSERLWYHRSFHVPPHGKTDRVLLHFGAVDWQATIYVNGKEVGSHKGGYTEFTLDITPALNAKDNDILVKVYDPSDEGVGPHGKQVLHPQDIYYTPTSGIWQTVWLEVVPAEHIDRVTLTPDIDHEKLQVTVTGQTKGLIIKATIPGMAMTTTQTGDLTLTIPHPDLWSPEHPKLYPLFITIEKNGRVIDQVRSYFGMRKISIAKDAEGYDRICLNNKPYYNLGVLDQGFWPDGIYTAPTDEALAFDIKAIKAMGFNTIRKHIKVEPARWYYDADSLGMLVWQDMVNPNQGLPEGAKEAFENQAAETLTQLHNYPSIVTWVLFNEKWGQYDQKRLTDWIKATDPSRIVNGHTGEILYVNDRLRSPSPDAYVDADMTDMHSYPSPRMPLKQPGKAQVVGEFGGIGVFIPDHQWISNSAWGYVQVKPAELALKYRLMVDHLALMEQKGLGGSIYTQPFDVEGEQNGLMTYDREVTKIPFSDIRRINALLNPTMPPMGDVTARDADLTDPTKRYATLLEAYMSGQKDADLLRSLARAAMQCGDKDGAEEASNALCASLNTPLSDADIQLIGQCTRSSSDAGFQLMRTQKDAFQKIMGAKSYHSAIVNAIYAGALAPVLDTVATPDWTSLIKKVTQFGPEGEEIAIRAATIDYLNKKDWTRFVPSAKEYLQKFGANASERDRQLFEQTIKDHDQR